MFNRIFGKTNPLPSIPAENSETRGTLGERAVADIAKQKQRAKGSKVGYIGSVSTLGLIAFAAIGLGVLGLMQAHGVNMPHIAPALNTLSSPHHVIFWVVGGLGAAGGGTLIYGIIQDRRARKLEKEEKNEAQKRARNLIIENPHERKKALDQFGDHFEYLGVEDRKDKYTTRLTKSTYAVDIVPDLLAKTPAIFFLVIQDEDEKIKCTKELTPEAMKLIVDMLIEEDFKLISIS